jgi:hypothetical protein
MRIVKPLLRILLAVLLLGAVGLGVLYHLSKRTPARYTPAALSLAQIEEASARVDTQKMPDLLNLASKAHAAASATHNAQSRGRSVPTGATQPGPVTVTFTQDEVNSSIIKWSQHYQEKLDRYVTQPYVAIEKDQIILMGTVPELSRVVSMYLQPRIDEKGQLRCEATNVYLGTLPLPGSLFTKYRAKVEGSLKSNMPQWQRGAKMDAGGAVNPDARAVLLSRLALQILNNESGPAFLYLPYLPDRDKNWDKTVAVRLINLAIDKGAVTITVQPTTPDERAALVEQIRQPVQSAVTNAPPQE